MHPQVEQLAAGLPPGLQKLVPTGLTRRDVLAGGLLFVCYLVAAQSGSAFFTSPAVISAAPAVALAGLFLGGLRLWPVVAIAALINVFLNGSSSTLSFVLYPLAQTLQASLGVYLLQKLNFDPVLRRLSDILSIIGVAFVVSTIVPTAWALIRYLNTAFGVSINPPTVTWASLWVGYFLSLLVVAPLIMRWVAKPHFVRTQLALVETFTVLSIVAGISYLIFWTPFNSLAGVSLVYALLMPLFWVAIRFGPRFTILSIFIVMMIGLFGTLYGPMMPTVEHLGNRLFQLEIFFIILAFIFYIVTALQEEKRVATKELTSYITQLERALNKLSMQDRAKSEFVAVLAHELRNPLAPIVSSLELLRLQVPQQQENEEVLELMDNRLKTIQRLLDDLLDVSRISQAKLKLKKETVELRPIVERSLQSVAHYLKSREQTLMLDLAKEPLVLEADPVRIEQVVSNLLTNASKFTPQGGRIAVTTRKEGGMAVLRVTDSGIGIDSAFIDRIFEPFTQLGKSGGEGLGIGLSLTQKLAEMHGGTVEVRSEGQNKGSEFTVRLPVVPTGSTAFVTQPGRKGTTVSPQGATGMRVLVVDDNEAAARGIGKLLGYKGYTVEYAASGEEAREKTIAFAPAAVVLDIGLPDMDGYQVAQLIKKDGFMGKLVALTGYGQEEDRERAYEAGFNHHLTKPISIADLEAVLV